MSSRKYETIGYTLKPVYALKRKGRQEYVCYYNIGDNDVKFDSRNFALLHTEGVSYVRFLAEKLSTICNSDIVAVRVGVERKYVRPVFSQFV